MRAPLRFCLLCVGLLAHATLLAVSPAQAQYVINGTTETVPGSHATPWMVPGSGTNLIIGSTGTGGLDIVSGGIVTSAYAILGDQAGSSGAINIVGTGSVWNTDGATIGNDGAAAVNITSGGVANSTSSIYLGYNNGPLAVVGTVAGAGSAWNLDSNDLYVGYSGTATLNVNDGAAVTMGSAYIGYSDNGNGIVNVTNGSTVQSGSVILGYYGDNMTGTMNLSGAGTLWAVTGYIDAAYDLGNGFINVTNGAHLTATQGLYLGDCCDPGDSGAMTVSGAGSSAVFGDDVFVGTGVQGTLTVSNGASFSTAGILQIGDGSEGTVTISGEANVSANGVTIANGGTGKLIFGAAANEPAVAPGTLVAPTITFGGSDGEIIFNHTGNISLFPALAGNGDISVLAGTTTFGVTSIGYTGNIDITGGKAMIDAFLPGDVTVSGSGILGGSGTVASLDAQSGGTVAPGSSPGTLNVTGNVSFAPGSNYAVEVAGAQSDLINATGAANLTGGAVRVSGFPSLMQYTILTATGGVTGTFAGVFPESAFILYSLDYDANNVYLNVDGFNSFTVAARTPNQRAVANVLDQLPSNDPLFSAIIASGDADAQQAFNALSGEIHASVGIALADDSRYVREAITGRLIQAYYGGMAASGGQSIALAAAPTYTGSIDTSSRMSPGLGYGSSPEAPAEGRNLAYWSRAFGAWGQYNADNAATTDRNLDGFITGVDGNLGGGWRGGLAMGYMHTGLDTSAGYFSSAEIDSYVLGGYAGGSIGDFAFRSGGTWAWSNVDSSRSVVLPGFFESEGASYGGDVGQLFGELAYPIFTHGGFIEPFAGLAYVHVGTDGFTESGPIAGLTSGGSDMDLGYGTLGVRASTTVMWDGMTVNPHGSLAWQYAFGDTTPQQALAFASTGIGMGISGVPSAQNSALLEIGADVMIAQDATLGLSYIGQYAGDFTDNGLRGRFNWKF